MPSSVETVTILITDLVGSTGLESRIGPAAADTLREEHFALLRAAFAEADGREVKNTGDGLVAAFDSSSAAVTSAVAIQQRFERRNRSADEQLLVKIGISLGDATVAGDDYFGMPVIEAARLCARASGGQILAKEIVAHLAGGRAGHTFTPLGDLELKGLPELLPTVEVTWEPLDAEQPSLPLPPRLQGLPPVAFVGRSGERERIGTLFEEVCDGKRRVALISGEPGIGKTRLAAHCALEARAQGATILYGRADEEVALPYGPWVEALSHYVATAPERVLSAHTERHGGDLTRLVPTLRERLPTAPTSRETDPDTERYLLWGAVAGLLREAASEQPVVLFLDDLHWADKPTLLLLKHIVRQGADIRVLMMGTYRESDLSSGHPLSDLVADLHREQGVERIALKGLEEPDIVEIMERAAGHELDEIGLGLARELFRETDGSPFYTAELLRHLRESGAIYEHDGRLMVRGSVGELGIPQSVREVVGHRVERLGEETRKTLQMAAVIGREFDQELLQRVTGQSEDELLDLLEEAVEASVLSESTTIAGRFSFAHALISHTLYEDLGTTRRARVHRRVGEALEELAGPDPAARVSELAHHWAKATTTVEVEKAIDYARLAGERALTELAPDEGLRWFSQALDLQAQQVEVDPAVRADLLIGVGEAQRQVGEAAFRETLLEASRIASDLRDADRATRAALANNRGQTSVYGEVDEERLQALERALELDPSADRARRARLMSLQAIELLFDPDHVRRRILAREALVLAREAGDPHTLAHVLKDQFPVFWTPDTLDLRRALVPELLETVARVGDPALEAWAAMEEANVSVESGELERGAAAVGRFRAIADEIAEPTLRWFAAFYDACLAILYGRLAEAERHAEEALRLGSDAGQPDALMVYAGQLSLIRQYQRPSEKIVALVKASVEAHPGIPAWKAGLAEAYCWTGRTPKAAVILEEAAKDGFAHLPHDEERSIALAVYADVAAEVDSRDAAAALHELIEPWADQIVWNGGVTYGHVQMYLGLLTATLGLDERADEHFASACELQEQKGMVLWAARARLSWGEALARRGERERAAAEAARALELAREHGYEAIEQRAAGLVETGSPTQR